MGKILGVIGSPRKNGNTDIMVSRILAGAHDRGPMLKRSPSPGSGYWNATGAMPAGRGDTNAARRDDMRLLYPKIAQSDAIVFGTPVYWYGPTALMKCFIDRFVYFNCPENRKQIKGKAAVIAIPFEDRTIATSDLVVDFFEKSLEYLESNADRQSFGARGHETRRRE